MKRLLALLACSLSLLAHAEEYQASLVVETGVLKESDLIVRNISDLNKGKTCLAFYVQTAGTSPVIYCYDAAQGFGAQLSQVGHIKADDLVIRKLDDTKNNVSCLVAYVSTPGTAPAVDCFSFKQRFKDNMVEAGHLQEGDMHVRRIVDSGNQKTCLVTYVDTKGTEPSVTCYDSQGDGKGGLYQSSQMKSGDLVVRKIVDSAAHQGCMVSYVATKGTSTHVYCYKE
jgi:hypothetical protein